MYQARLFGGLLNVDASGAALVSLKASLGRFLDGGLALHDLLALGQDVRPVLEYCEWDIFARAVVDQVVTLLGE